MKAPVCAHATSRRRRRRVRDSGAALIEFVIVLPLLVALLFGVIDFGFVLSDQISLRQGVREGARQAVVAASNAEDHADIVGFTKERIGVDPDHTSVYVKVAGFGDASVGEVGSELTVCATLPMDSLSGVFSTILDGRYLTSQTTMRVEQELQFTTAGGDVDPTGRNWTWC